MNEDAELLARILDGAKDDFVEIVQRQMDAEAVPRVLAYVPRRHLEKIMGWNLILKARKPNR